MTHPIEVVEADVREVVVDVLALKFSGRHHGADSAVASALGTTLATDTGQHRFVPTGGAIRAHEVLVIGTVPLRDFGYGEVRTFARDAVVWAASRGAATVGLTVHGPGFGLDELASIDNLIRGITTGLATSARPPTVRIIERNASRAARIREYLAFDPSRGRDAFSPDRAAAISDGGRYGRRAFVAMPFAEAYIPHWEQALEPAAHANEMIVERLDRAYFMGEIMAEIRRRIERSSAVLAVLDGLNPNVFLEVGYAWGLGKPTILVMRDGTDAPFDVQGHRILRYTSLQELRKRLEQELAGLISARAL